MIDLADVQQIVDIAKRELCLVIDHLNQVISYLTIVPSVDLVGQSQTGLYYSAEGRSHLVRDI